MALKGHVRRAALPGGDELRHESRFNSYVLESAGRCVSVSQVASVYFPFDSKAAAAVIAAHRNVPVESVTREWDESRFLGSLARDRITARMLGYPAPVLRFPPQAHLDTFLNGVDKAVADIHSHFTVLGVNVLAADVHLRVATTIDFVLRSKSTHRLLVGTWRMSAVPRPRFFLNTFDRSACPPLCHLANNTVTRAAFTILLNGLLLRRSGLADRYATGSGAISPVRADMLDYAHVTVRRGMFEDYDIDYRAISPGLILPPEEGASADAEGVDRLLFRAMQEATAGSELPNYPPQDAHDNVVDDYT